MATSSLHDNFASPNAIPPRTSSNRLSATLAPASNNAPTAQTSVHVLRPKPEAEWIARPKEADSRGTLVDEKGVENKSLHGMVATPMTLDAHKASVVGTQQADGQAGDGAETSAAPPETISQGGGNQPPELPLKSVKRGPINNLPTWTPQKESVLLAPYTYLENHPGKDIRSQLINAFDAWLQVPPSSLSVITRVVGMLHTSSLLVDDVEDSSVLRRGVPVAHSIFGTAQTINSANYVYFLALQELAKLQNAECNSVFVTELLNLHRGQGMDLFWRDTLTCPSEEDYLEMVGNKTGGLFRLAVKLMMAESGLSRKHSGEGSTATVPDCVPLVSTVGLLFQVLDDYLNLQSTAYTERKGLCEDLTEGKFSFPVIHAIRSASETASQQQQQAAHQQLRPSPPRSPVKNGAPTKNGIHLPYPPPQTYAPQTQPYQNPTFQPPPYTNNILLNILSQRTHDIEVKKYAVRYMEQCGSFAYTRKVIKELHAEASRLVEEVAARVAEVGGQERGEEGARGLRGILGLLKVE